MTASSALRIRKSIAVIETFGGVIGAVFAAVIAPRLASSAHLPVWETLAWLSPAFLLSGAAGILLWRDTVMGQGLSLVVLALQVPVISNESYGYFFNSGLALRIMLGPGGWSWYAFLGSQIHFSWSEGASGTTIGANVVGLVLGALLFVAIPTKDSREDVTIAAKHSSVDHLPNER